MSTENTEINTSSIEQLSSSIKSIANGFRRMTYNLENLSRVNDSFVAFNQAFGSFLLSMAINDATIDWKKGPTDKDIELLKERKRHIKTIEAVKSVSNTPMLVDDRVIPIPSVSSPKKRKSNESSRSVRIAKKKKTEPIAVSRPQFVIKINIHKIIDRLPLKYRESAEPRSNMETVLKVLKTHPAGLSFKGITSAAKIPQHKVTDCVNALTHAKEVLRMTENKVSVFKLDPVKYPSELNKK
ncbi:uncharacterized protein B0P05DRAFT_546278 [Gilbertella persicaria]|uniref:uncharacterized protein n=1 Tax=Gilbertella persicaria TaxID=101096 RepID=UPI00221FE238|nr:uncharacterized protein B0P05DRAFT_546278 [Gilbertella persicaria]KAI8076537.1 hypothetical protein B0P05DRAFT_546278 [Gilbertella persicaria]